jgi:hypothetical protein
MRRLRLAFAAGALVTAGALFSVWLARAPQRSVSATPATPSPIGVVPEPPGAELPVTPSAPPHEPAANAPPAAKTPPDHAPRPDATLAALEERALRRVDVAAVLESAGVDRRALERRPDADDFVRRLAADELLIQRFMRQLFTQQVYEPSYPRDAALGQARSAAKEVLEGMTPAERIRQLEEELARPPAPAPEPTYSAKP